MYVCGPTVYDLAHIGNARPVVVFDVLFRLLRQLYGADHVTYVRNITDVDDKINARAPSAAIPIAPSPRTPTPIFKADMAALGALPPDYRAARHRYQPHMALDMIALIERLIANGHAYAAEATCCSTCPRLPTTAGCRAARPTK